jgi:hypothetical protein
MKVHISERSNQIKDGGIDSRYGRVLHPKIMDKCTVLSDFNQQEIADA